MVSFLPKQISLASKIRESERERKKNKKSFVGIRYLQSAKPTQLTIFHAIQTRARRLQRENDLGNPLYSCLSTLHNRFPTLSLLKLSKTIKLLCLTTTIFQDRSLKLLLANSRQPDSTITLPMLYHSQNSRYQQVPLLEHHQPQPSLYNQDHSQAQKQHAVSYTTTVITKKQSSPQQQHQQTNPHHKTRQS